VVDVLSKRSHALGFIVCRPLGLPHPACIGCRHRGLLFLVSVGEPEHVRLALDAWLGYCKGTDSVHTQFHFAIAEKAWLLGQDQCCQIYADFARTVQPHPGATRESFMTEDTNDLLEWPANASSYFLNLEFGLEQSFELKTLLGHAPVN
jgi:hypothetical protein